MKMFDNSVRETRKSVFDSGEPDHPAIALIRLFHDGDRPGRVDPANGMAADEAEALDQPASGPALRRGREIANNLSPTFNNICPKTDFVGVIARRAKPLTCWHRSIPIEDDKRERPPWTIYRWRWYLQAD